MTSDDLPTLIHFSGVARLFPLPNVVLFPYVTQPLHIFEPRYRQMTADALASDRLIAMALLRPGWESDYEGRPPIHPVVCLSRIVSEERLKDGRYNLQLRGLIRARVTREVDNDKLYRSARVDLLRDGDLPAAAAEKDLRKQFLDILPSWCKAQAGALELLRRLLQSELSIGAVCDIISYALPLGIDLKQELLSMPEVERRAQKLVLHLRDKGGPNGEGRTFPPDFSPN